jgi:hypothetical protein
MTTTRTKHGAPDRVPDLTRFTVPQTVAVAVALGCIADGRTEAVA